MQVECEDERDCRLNIDEGLRTIRSLRDSATLHHPHIFRMG